MTVDKALAEYIAARNRYDGTRASEQLLDDAARQLGEAHIRALGADPPTLPALQRYWQR